MLIKFNTAGRWADPRPWIEQIQVSAGEVREVSHGLADIVIAAGKGQAHDVPVPNSEDVGSPTAKAKTMQALGIKNKRK